MWGIGGSLFSQRRVQKNCNFISMSKEGGEENFAQVLGGSGRHRLSSPLTPGTPGGRGVGTLRRTDRSGKRRYQCPDGEEGTFGRIGKRDGIER